MKRIFHDVIEAYHGMGGFESSDDLELETAVRVYEESLPSFQEFFRKILVDDKN